MHVVTVIKMNRCEDITGLRWRPVKILFVYSLFRVVSCLQYGAKFVKLNSLINKTNISLP